MSLTKMKHPDKPEERIINIPLNEWARYRASGYEFCNSISADEEAEYNAEADKVSGRTAASEKLAKAQAKDEKKDARKTTPKAE